MRDTTDADLPNPHIHIHVRALFISDVHLGTRTSQAGALLEFMKHVEADTIYLVGDIIDFWRVAAVRSGRRRTTTCCRS